MFVAFLISNIVPHPNSLFNVNYTISVIMTRESRSKSSVVGDELQLALGAYFNPWPYKCLLNIFKSWDCLLERSHIFTLNCTWFECILYAISSLPQAYDYSWSWRLIRLQLPSISTPMWIYNARNSQLKQVFFFQVPRFHLAYLLCFTHYKLLHDFRNHAIMAGEWRP